MSESVATFLFEIANFVAFVALLGWLFVKPVRKYLDEQSARDAEARQAAQQQLEKARSLRRQAEQQLQQLAEELEQRRRAAAEEASEEAENRIHAVEQEIAQRREQFQRELERDRQAGHAELATQIARATGLAVSRLLEELDTAGLNGALVASACEKLVHASPDSHPRGSWVVESAQELSSEDRKRFQQAVDPTAEPVSLEFRVNRQLLGGVRVLGPDGMVDHSIAGLAEYIRREMQRNLNHHG